MKKVLMVMVVAALVAMAGSAKAATTNVVVQAEVVGTCKFNSASTTLNFGPLPVDGSGNALGATQTGSATFWCTRGATYAITDDDGANDLVANGNRMISENLITPEYIPYSFTYTPTGGTGNGPGVANYITLTYTATVGNTYTNNSADTYSDTVVVTITP